MPDTSNPFGTPANESEVRLPMTEEAGAVFEGPPPPPQPDLYPCKVIAVEYGKKEGGTFGYWKWTYQILGNGKWAGDELVDITSLSPKAAFKLAQVIRVFGFEPEGKVDMGPSDFINKKATLKTILGDYKGEPQARVDKVLKYEETASTAGPFSADPPKDNDDIPY